MLNTIYLRTFLTVVEAGNYTAAADQLHMSQPAVSMHIRSLEEQLGNIRLFRRVGQRMVPTHAGEELLAAARELVTLSERTEQNIRALKGQITGRVTIGCTPSSGEHLLPPLLALFLIQCPEVAIEVLVEPGEVLIEALNEQRVALLFLEEQQRRRGWESHFLGSESLHLLAPPDHPLLQNPDQPAASLRDYPLIMPNSNAPLRRTIEDGLRRRGVSLNHVRVAMETASTAMMIRGVQDGLGLAFIPATRIPSGCPLHTVELSSTPIQQEWYVLRTRRRSPSRAVQELHSFLTSPTALALLARHGLHSQRG